MSRSTVAQTKCDRCGSCSVADDESLVLYGWAITADAQVCFECTDKALTAGFYFAEGIAAAIEAEKLAREYGWERCVIEWDEATRTWTQRSVER